MKKTSPDTSSLTHLFIHNLLSVVKRLLAGWSNSLWRLFAIVAMLSRKKRLIVVSVVILVLVPLFVVYSNFGPRVEIVPAQVIVSNTDNIPVDHTMMIGSVNCDEWHCPPFTGYLVDDLRLHHHQWPKHPTTRRSSSVVHVNYERLQYVGAKLYGYILPPNSGIYQFRIRQIACTAAVNGELWISSDSNPMNLQKLTQLTFAVKDRGFFSYSNVSDHISMKLQNGRSYYFEFHVKGFDGKVDMSVEWKLPLYEYFQPIPSASLAMAIELQNFNSSKLSSIIKTLQSENLPSNKLQSTGYIKHITYNVSKVTKLNILPNCELPKPALTYFKFVPFVLRFQVYESLIYPPDTNEYTHYNKVTSGPKGLSKNRTDYVLKLYRQEFDKQNRQSGKVLGVHYLEESYVEGFSGSRFLLELDIQSNDEIVRTSEYVYLPNGGTKLCHTSNFQWKQNAHVSLVVAIKNLGNWVDHLIHNIEDIYIQTKDEHFELVVVDFESDDKDIKSELMKSSIPKWKLIPLKGRFSRAAGLQAGIDYVTDNNSIVITIDMHLTLPPNFIESVRKHTIQGKMVCSPMFYKLNPGYTENNINGFWMLFTYGLFSMYKSDWNTIGAYDTANYRYKWGGEDIDMFERTISKGYDIFHFKIPGLFHYYHSYAGMWDQTNHRHKYLC